jgi:hypothetical protein
MKERELMRKKEINAWTTAYVERIGRVGLT